MIDTEDRIHTIIRGLAEQHDVWPTMEDLFAYDSDADAKLMGLALAGHIEPTRVASSGPDRQVWEFSIDGALYLLSIRDGYTEGFEPIDAQSFDRLAADMPDPDIHTFA